MKLDRMVKRLYKPLFPLLTTAVISGCSARAEPGYTPTPSTPASIVRETPTPTYPITITPTPASIPTPLVTPTVTPTPQLPQSVLNQLSYLPDNVRTALIDELKTDTDWDRDGIVNPSDSFVIDPSNTISQPRYQTIVFIKNLKQRNKDGLLPQVYNQLAKALFTVDNNQEYFQETTPDRAHITVKLVDGIQTITKYPRGLSLGAVQAESQKLTDDYAIDSFVVPAIGYIVSLQEESKINVLNGWEIPDKALEDDGIRQVLLPIELLEVNIRSGVRTTANIKTGLLNVTPNTQENAKSLGITYYPELNGKSPQEWLREMAVRDYGDKTHIVWKWINEFPADYGPRDVWTNSWQAYSKAVKTIDNLLLFIREYPIFLRGPPSGNLVPQLTEQTSPYYSVLLGRLFGKAVSDVVAKYPTDASGRFTHSEPFILMVNSSEDLLLPYRFGFWLKKQPFIDDYKGKPYSTPYAEVRRANGTYERIRLN